MRPWLVQQRLNGGDYRVVYFAWISPLSAVKVGASWRGRIHARIREIQTYCPGPIDYWIAFPCDEVITERAAHEILKGCHTHGEWFHDASYAVTRLVDEWEERVRSFTALQTGGGL